MLIRSFNLIDIKKYENDTGKNILSFFDNIKFENILDLISLGNGNCGAECASDILDNYLKNGNNLMDAILEIKQSLVGVGSNSDDDIDEADKIDISKYDSLTDLYISFSMQLMSVGISYNEFWSMNTKEMYKVFNSIAVKMQNETNRELSNYHTLAAMIGGAVWGKLQKEPPRINITKNDKQEVDDMDVEDAVMVAKLASLAAKFKNKGE